MSEDKTAESLIELWMLKTSEAHFGKAPELSRLDKSYLKDCINMVISAERQAKADLERRLGIAEERLQSIVDAPASYPKFWFGAIAEKTLNEIRAKEGGGG